MKNLLNKQHHLSNAQMILELLLIACVNLISMFLICFAYYLHCSFKYGILNTNACCVYNNLSIFFPNSQFLVISQT